MRRTMYRAATALALFSLLPSAFALQGTGQLEFFGRWDDPDPGTLPPTENVSREFYVSATRGNDANTGATPGAPKRTITDTLANLDDPLEFRVTINVGPGVYDVAGGETFPLELPAHGICLEFWPEYALCDPVGVPDSEVATIAGDFMNAVIEVGEVGNQELPATVLRSLEIVDGFPGIQIAPALGGAAPPPEPVAVEVRKCTVFDCATAITVDTPTGWEAFHVLEQNTIGEPVGVSGFFGYQESCSGVGSTLLRANEIMNFEFNVQITGNGADCAPRLFSNFVQLGETNVVLLNCFSDVRNNTIAYAMNHGGAGPFIGLAWVGGGLQLHNNILWNPDSAAAGVVNAVDIQPAAPAGSMTNHILDITPTPPGFIGYGPVDAHPGALAAEDLHLEANSTMIGGGTPAMIANLALPATPYLEAAVGGFDVRVDVNADIDMQPRLSQTAGEGALDVDIGADEVNVSEISLLAPLGPTPFSQSENGDLLAVAASGNSRDFTMDLFFTGPPNGRWDLFLAYGFFDQVSNPATGNVLQNGPIREHSQPGFGSLLFDLTVPNSNFVTTGFFDGAGMGNLPGLQLNGINVHELEGEMYFQLIAADLATGRLELSSRQYIELSDSFRGTCPAGTAPTTP